MARKIIPLQYKKSPFKFNPMTIGAIGGGLGLLGEILNYRGESSLEEQFGQMKKDLIDTDVSRNFYKDIVNPYAGLTDPMASVETKAEDLTINQQAARQQERALQQGLSETLEQSKRTGTQSTQAIANQLTKATGDIAAGIGEQERQNQMMALKEKSELDIRKAESKKQTDLMTRQGEFQTQMQMIKGKEDVLSRQLNKQQALLSLVSGEIAREDVQRQQDKTFLGINWKW